MVRLDYGHPRILFSLRGSPRPATLRDSAKPGWPCNYNYAEGDGRARSALKACGSRPTLGITLRYYART